MKQHIIILIKLPDIKECNIYWCSWEMVDFINLQLIDNTYMNLNLLNMVFGLFLKSHMAYW
jgi:hypothetical protein